MIQVISNAIEDLSKLLAKHGQVLPRRLFFQLDNCGENKNKYVFSYQSLLIEKAFFDFIKVNFLIVGHTHGYIDQYFSTRSRLRDQTTFIGSPLSLWNTFNDDQCSISKEITIIYNWKSWFHPVINNKLKFYQLPHVFKFRRHATFNRCICQYKPFSSSPNYLPIEPSVIGLTEGEAYQKFEKIVSDSNGEHY